MTSITLAAILLSWLTFQVIWGTSHAASRLYVYDMDQGTLTPVHPQISTRDLLALSNPLRVPGSAVSSFGNKYNGQQTTAGSGYQQLLTRDDNSALYAYPSRSQIPQQSYLDQNSDQNYAVQGNDAENGWEARSAVPWQGNAEQNGGLVFLIPSSGLQDSGILGGGFDVDPATTTPVPSTSTVLLPQIIPVIVSNPQTMSATPLINTYAGSAAATNTIPDTATPQPLGTGPGGPWDYASMNEVPAMFSPSMNDPAMVFAGPPQNIQPGQQQMVIAQFGGF